MHVPLHEATIWKVLVSPTHPGRVLIDVDPGMVKDSQESLKSGTINQSQENVVENLPHMTRSPQHM